MSTNNKALMTHYAEGSIISRELEAMMYDYAAEMRFDLELASDLETYTARAVDVIVQTRNSVLIHKGNPES